jgi:hypothetical protein
MGRQRAEAREIKGQVMRLQDEKRRMRLERAQRNQLNYVKVRVLPTIFQEQRDFNKQKRSLHKNFRKSNFDIIQERKKLMKQQVAPPIIL